ALLARAGFFRKSLSMKKIGRSLPIDQSVSCWLKLSAVGSPRAQFGHSSADSTGDDVFDGRAFGSDENRLTAASAIARRMAQASGRALIINRVHGKTMPIRIRVVAIALSVALGFAGAACLTHRSAKDPTVSSKRMPDGKQWTTENLNVDPDGSCCYEDSELNCAKYGRLYTWDSAQRGCQSLGDGWRLPTNDEWRQLAKHHGGLREESDDSGKVAYTALQTGGSSGFNAVLGGGRVSDDEQYARLVRLC